MNPRSLLVSQPEAVLIARDEDGAWLGGWHSTDQEGFEDAIWDLLRCRDRGLRDRSRALATVTIELSPRLAARLCNDGAATHAARKKAKRLERRLQLAPGGCPMLARGARAVLEATGMTGGQLEQALDLPPMIGASMMEGRGALKPPELVERWNASGRPRLVYRLEVGRPEGWVISVFRMGS